MYVFVCGLQVIRERHFARTSDRLAMRLRLDVLQCWGRTVREQQLLRRRCAKLALAHRQACRILHGWQVKSVGKTFIHTVVVVGSLIL